MDQDFEKNKNNVIFINLGTNDADYVDDDSDNRANEFFKEFDNFLQTSRNKSTDDQIFTFYVL